MKKLNLDSRLFRKTKITKGHYDMEGTNKKKKRRVPKYYPFQNTAQIKEFYKQNEGKKTYEGWVIAKPEWFKKIRTEERHLG